MAKRHNRSDQRSKGRKRPSEWHNRSDVAKKWFESVQDLPDTGAAIDFDLSKPQPPRRVGNSNRGDAM